MPDDVPLLSNDELARIFHEIGDILETYRRLATVPIEVEHDPALLRPLEQRVKVGDSGKLRALGWRPRYGLDETLRTILDYWRAVPGRGA